MIQKHFGVDIYKEWEKLLGKYLVKKHNHEKLNGSIIQEITGKTAADLGKVMRVFYTMFEASKQSENYVLVHNQEQMKKFFTEWYENFYLKTNISV